MKLSLLITVAACLVASATADDDESGEFESGEIFVVDVEVPQAIPSTSYSSHPLVGFPGVPIIQRTPVQAVTYASQFGNQVGVPQHFVSSNTFRGSGQTPNAFVNFQGSYQKPVVGYSGQQEFGTAFFQGAVSPTGAVSNAIGGFVQSPQPEVAVGGQFSSQQAVSAYTPPQQAFFYSQDVQRPQYVSGTQHQQQIVGQQVPQFNAQGIYPNQFQQSNIRGVPQYVAGQQGFTHQQQGFTPYQQSLTPQQQSFTPYQQSFTPLQQTYTAQHQSSTPQQQIAANQQQGFASQQQALPYSQDFADQQQGITNQQSPQFQQTYNPLQSQYNPVQGVPQYNSVQGVQSGKFAATNPAFSNQAVPFTSAQTGQGFAQEGQYSAQLSQFGSQTGQVAPSTTYSGISPVFGSTQQFGNPQTQPFVSGTDFGANTGTVGTSSSRFDAKPYFNYDETNTNYGGIPVAGGQSPSPFGSAANPNPGRG